jgi:hypothetical protein
VIVRGGTVGTRRLLMLLHRGTHRMPETNAELY